MASKIKFEGLIQPFFFGFIYLCFAYLGFFLSVKSSNFIPIWMPVGIFVIPLIKLDFKKWYPYIFAAITADLIFSLTIYHNLTYALLLPLSNTLDAVIGALLFKKFFKDFDLIHISKSLLGFFITCGILGTIFSSVVMISLHHYYFNISFWDNAILIWTGKILGLVLVGTIFVGLTNNFSFVSEKLKHKTKLFFETALTLSIVSVLTFLIFNNSLGWLLSHKYLVLVIMLWTIFRLGTPGTVLANICVAIIVTFSHNENAEILLWRDGNVVNIVSLQIQIFLCILSITSIYISAIVLERKNAFQFLKNSQASLNESSKIYNSLLETTKDGFYIVDINGKFFDANDNYLRLTGFDLDQLVGKDISSIELLNDGLTSAENLQQIKANGFKRYESQHKTQSGALLDLEISATYLSYENYFIVFSQDISDRKRVLEALTISEDAYKSLFENSPIAIWEEDLSEAIEELNRIKKEVDQNIEHYFEENPEEIMRIASLFKVSVVNETSVKTLKSPSKEHIKTPLFSYFTINSLPFLQSELIAFSKGEVTYSGEIEILNYLGQIRYFALNFNVIPGHEKTYDKVLVSFLDITDRWETQNRLTESEFMLRESQRVAKIGYYVFHIYANRWTSSEMLDEIFGINKTYDRTVHGWLGIIHPEDVDEMASYLTTHVLTEGKPFDRIYRIVRVENQEVRWVHGLGNLEFDSANKPVKMFGTIQDITDRFLLNEKIMSQAKIVQNVSDVIIGTDINYNITSWNSEAARLFGWEESEVLGKELNILTKTVTLDMAFEEAKEVLLKNGKWSGQTIHTDKSGVQHFFLSTFTLLNDFKGLPVSIVLVSKDISALRSSEQKLIESERRFKMLAESVNVVAWEYEYSTDRFSYVSPQSEILLGYKPDEWENLDWWLGRLHQEDYSDKKNWFNFDNFQKDYTFEYRFYRKDGKEIWIENLVNAEYENDVITRLRGIILDISERVSKDNELLSAKEKAEAANFAKSEFLSNISHELRTPLNGINGFIQLMIDSTSLSQEQIEFLNIIKFSSNNLTNIINDLLDFSRIDNKKLVITNQQFNIRELVDTIVIQTRQLAEQKGLYLNCSFENECGMFLGDKTRIAQILINILGNAVKYTNHGGVNLNISCENILKFTVTDTGIGIPDSLLSDIFEPFKQLESPYVKTHQGVGLGLAIVKQLIDLMGGTISVNSKIKAGSTFVVSIPQANYSDGSVDVLPAAEKLTKRNLNEFSILIVEDDYVNQILIERLLKPMGLKIDIATNGKIAVEKAVNNPYDLILMDIGLPVMNGIEATKKIRAREIDTKCHIPIVALTAHAYEEDRKRCFDSGMDDFLTKPIVESTLNTILNKYLIN